MGILLQGLLFVVLLILLSSTPGSSQYGVNHGRCPSKELPCPNGRDFLKYVERVLSYEKCPDNILLKIVFLKGVFSAQASEPWVKILVDCLDTGREKCLSNTENKYANLCSKESKTKSIMTTTTTTVSTAKSTISATQYNEQPPVTTSIPSTPRLTTTRQERWIETKYFDGIQQDGKNIHNGSEGQQGVGPTDSKGEPGEKTKTTTIAVISLIVICLVLVAILTGVFCKRKKTNSYQKTTMDEPL
ncbi:Hypothetical predicted protein [Pelobates cultripes]|uniref:Transmembrane chemokine CXCL16 n=1 Tax=Pelobates cultripes TaxID=61616 RepID=A0AAD1RJL2_PELCU|nr:Hypothetical predicted protein [Pelobates cultripes]